MRTFLCRCAFSCALFGTSALAQAPVVHQGGVGSAASFAKAGTPRSTIAPASIVSIFGSNLAVARAPVVYQGGVVNAASFAKAGTAGSTIAPGSIVSIFGSNLAASMAQANQVPLPDTLAGTSVTFGGVPAPLFYVSPGQINAQAPAGIQCSDTITTANVVVQTAAGSSAPVPVEVSCDGLGIFTTDASSCGPGAVFNVAPDGSVSLNSPSNSAQAGQFLSVYGTGLGALQNMPNDGEPAPLSPLLTTPDAIQGTIGYLYTAFAGKAPLEVGVDQFNFQLLPGVQEGCTIPLTIAGTYSQSQPVPVSIHQGGGQCVDPPADSYGILSWTKSVTSGTTQAAAETFSADFPSAVHLQLPALPAASTTIGSGIAYPQGPRCAWADQQLDAGTLTIQGPGFGPVSVPKDSTGRYVLTLPAGTIQPGIFTLTASGGAVGAFTSSITIPEPIQLTTTFANQQVNTPVTVSWLGGDAQSLVDVVVGDEGYVEQVVPASAGTVTFPTQCVSAGLGPCTGQIFAYPTVSGSDVVVRQVAVASDVTTFQAQGLTLGARHVWTYEFRFTGVPF
jgi:uncharacterized protein (TIGR03437 family)